MSCVRWNASAMWSPPAFAAEYGLDGQSSADSFGNSGQGTSP